MAHRLSIALLLAPFMVLPMQDRPAAAQEPVNPELVIERRFEAQAIEAEWFAPNFLAQVPADRVAGIIASLEAGYGAFRSVSGGGHRFTVTFDRAEVPTRLVLDAKGRIAGLRFEAPGTLGGGLQEHGDAIAALPGRTAVFVTSGDETRIAHNPDEPLAVGSTAKLAVLKAVRDAVSEGQLTEVRERLSGQRWLHRSVRRWVGPRRQGYGRGRRSGQPREPEAGRAAQTRAAGGLSIRGA
jgi:hypothetical protein